MKGTVYAVEDGLAFVKLEDGRICWIETFVGHATVGDVLCGDLLTRGRCAIVNESRSLTMSVLVQWCTSSAGQGDV